MGLAERTNMAQPRYVSTSQVASALGVSVTTVKRWVDEGILPAQKTAGGHRKLPLADVLRVAREERFPALDLARLDLGPRQARDPAACGDQLTDALKAGAVGPVRALIHGAYGAGTAVETLADTLIAPAMAAVGHEWEKGRLDVYHEHRATQLCAAALF